MNGHVQDELPALLGGELPPSAAAAVRAHLAACDRCRLELAAVAFAAGELRATARLPFADPAELPPLVLGPPAGAGVERPPEADAPLDLPASSGPRVGPAAVVVAATDDGLDPAYQATRQAAFAVAAREGARVVLFDRSPELYLVDPYERARRHNGGRPRSSLLNQRTASRLGRPYLAEQLAEARRLGLDGAAWVARGHGPEALAAACEVLDAERVVLPAALATPPLIDRVRGHTLTAFRRRVPARITLADLDGSLAEVD
jgi:anti-sigma factor RsiW